MYDAVTDIDRDFAPGADDAPRGNRPDTSEGTILRQTAKGLIAMWAERDLRYAGVRISEKQAGIIRTYRKREAWSLPPAERAEAWGVANAWVPA